MVAKDCPKKGSPKAIVGEIDTSAPFQSVKDAVNLFGEAAFSGEKPAIKKTKPHAAEITVGVLAKEYQLQLVQKELNKLKEQLKNAEISKVHALSDLAKAKQTVDDLISKLNIVSESKESAFKTAEEAKNQVKQIQETTSCHTNGHDGSRNQFLDTSRKEYISALAELEASKQELMKARRDCEAYEVAKNAAIKQAEDSKVAVILNIEKAGELSKQISTVNESIEQLKFANLHTGEKEANLNVDKDLEEESYKARVVESAKKLNALNEEVNSKLMQNLEPELAETESQIDLHQKRIDSIRASDRDSVIAITSELDNAKESLHKVSKQEITLRQLVETLKMDLENVKKELLEAKVKEAEAEYVAGNLHVKLRISKAELEAATAEDSKLGAASEETLSALHRLSLENESCRLEAEKMKHQAEELRIEAEAIRVVQQEVEKELKVALQAAEEAKSAEAKVLEQVKILSERANATRATTSEPGTTQITISKEEFESLSRKVEESDKLAEMKVAAAMAQVEAVKASEDEALRKLEATLKEIDNMKAATVEALKRTEMAEAAKKAVEGELRRWREREQKMAAEVMSRILAENEVSLPSCPTVPQKQSPPQNVTGEARKLERAKTSVSRKVLRPSISGIFSRKKNQVEGAYASYLPGEHPV